MAIRSLLAVTLLLVSRGALNGQLVLGNLVGTVTDSSGGSVHGASVEARSLSTGQVRLEKPGEAGQWSFGELTPGVYRLAVSAPGFATSVREAVEVQANRTVRADVVLTLAATKDAVTVSASSEELQSDRSERSAVLTGREVDDLPSAGQRNFQNLLKYIPGVTPPKAQNSLAGNPQGSLVVNVNGVSYAQNGNRIDGALNYFVALPHHAAYIPPAEAIESVNVVSGGFDAEQGLAGGAAINVTVRSGGNRFHGGVWEFNTDSALRARNFFYFGATVPKNILNQFGARLGGPIWKNKLFFYSDYEGTRNRQSANVLATVPTDAMKKGDFSATGTTIYDPSTGAANGTGRVPFVGQKIPASRFNPAAQTMMALLPEPNLPGFANNYFSSGSLRFDRDNVDAKVNANITSRLSLFGRYGTFGSAVFDPPTLGAAGGPGITSVQPGNATGRTHSANLGAVYVVNPSLVLDGYFGFTRQITSGENVDITKNYGLDTLKIPGTNGPNPLEGGYPGFNVTGFTAFGNPNVSNPYQWADNLYVWAGNVSYNRSQHNFRAGVEITRAELNHFQPQGSYTLRGSFSFTGGLTALSGGAAPNQFNGWGDYLLGLAQSFGKTTQYTIPSSVRTVTAAFYARDQWQIARRLTFNYGFRYEAYPPSRRPDTGLPVYSPTTNLVTIGGLGAAPGDSGIRTGSGQWAPRVGIAYRATDSLVIRAGYGMSVDPFSYGVFMRNVYPIVIGVQYTGATPYTAAGSLAAGIPAIPPVDTGNGIISIPGNVGTNTIPTDFRRGYIHSFNFTIQKNLGYGFTADAGYAGTRSIRQIAQVNVNAAGPGGGNGGRALASFARTADTIELTPFETANYNALQTTLRRSLRQGIFVSAAYTWSKAIAPNDNADSTLFYSWAPAWGLNRAVTGYDRTHNFSLTATAELPFGPDKPLARQGWAALGLGGWQLSAGLSAVSGLPFTVTSSGASLNAPGNSQTADQVVSNVAITGGVGTSASWFNPLAFRTVNAVRFGNSGLNTLRGPGDFNLDASLFRNFRIREKLDGQFRVEIFNVTNTPMFNNPAANVSSMTLNTDGTVRQLNGYSQVTSAQPTERQIRLALRFSF